MVVPLTPKTTFKTEVLVSMPPTMASCRYIIYYESRTVVYYESIKRELKRRLIYEYRCDERQKTKNEESTHLTDTGSRKREPKTFYELKKELKTDLFIINQ